MVTAIPHYALITPIPRQLSPCSPTLPVRRRGVGGMCAGWSGRPSPGFAMVTMSIISRGGAGDGVAFSQTDVFFVYV